jgi:hypothetical protein
MAQAPQKAAELVEPFDAGWGIRRYLFDFRKINIYFLFCRTNSVRDLIFV